MAIPMPGHDNLYYDNLVLFDCQDCKKSFILGKSMVENMAHKDIVCPYCHRHSGVAFVTECSDEDLKNIELGNCSLLWRKPE